MTMKIWKSLVVLLGGMGVAGCPAEPLLAIRPVKTAGGLVFQVKECRSKGGTPVIHTMTISKYELPRGGTSTVCRLNRMPGPTAEPGPALRGEWRYGDKPPGYEIGQCTALEPGRTYMVGVQGSGVGSQVFSVDSNGLVTLGEGECKYPE
jgi:hypothetical protein